MAAIIIDVPEDIAREIQIWTESHQRMIISSTVPALKHWDILTSNMRFYGVTI